MHFGGRLWQVLRPKVPLLAKYGYKSRGIITTFLFPSLPFLALPGFVADRQITFKRNDLKADSNHACTFTPQKQGACWNTPPSCCAVITRDLLDSSPLRACNCNKQTEINTDTLLQIAQSALQEKRKVWKPALNKCSAQCLRSLLAPIFSIRGFHRPQHVGRGRPKNAFREITSTSHWGGDEGDCCTSQHTAYKYAF